RVGVRHADLAFEPVRVTEEDAEDRTEVRHEPVARAARDEAVTARLSRRAAALAFEPVRVTEEDAEDRTEVRHEPVARAAGDEAVTDRLERAEGFGVQREVVDAAA